MSDFLKHYNNWIEYERYCLDAVASSLRSVPETGTEDPAYRKAVSLAAHIAAGLELWLARVEGREASVKHPFPAGVSLEEVEHSHNDVLNRWAQYINRLNENDLAQVIKYQNTSGVKFENSLEDILTSLFGHGEHHRGQIALLVRELGGSPAVTDYIAWVRKKEAQSNLSKGKKT